MTLGTGCDVQMYFDGSDFTLSVASGNMWLGGSTTCLLMNGANQKLGIGTTAPGRELQIQGNLRLELAGDDNQIIDFVSDSSKIKVAMGYSHNDNAFPKINQ